MYNQLEFRQCIISSILRSSKHSAQIFRFMVRWATESQDLLSFLVTNTEQNDFLDDYGVFYQLLVCIFYVKQRIQPFPVPNIFIKTTEILYIAQNTEKIHSTQLLSRTKPTPQKTISQLPNEMWDAFAPPNNTYCYASQSYFSNVGTIFFLIPITNSS